MIQKEEPHFLPRWYPQSWLLALFWGCLYIPRSSRCLSQTWMYMLAIRVSAGNYASGVSLWSHPIRASQLISLHLGFSACKADNNAGTTQRGLIEVLACPWLRGLQRYNGFFLIWGKVKCRCLTGGHYTCQTASSLHPPLGFGGSPPRTSCGSEPREALLKITVLALLLRMLQFIYFSFFKALISLTLLLKKWGRKREKSFN